MGRRSSLGGTSRLAWTVLAGLLAAAGCGDPSRIDADGGLVPVDGGPVRTDAGPGFRDGGGIGRTDLSLARLVPDHGPFTGGNTVVLRGSGFTDESQVTFGGRDVQPADHRLIDPRRLSVVVPAGEVGPVDVTITVGGETVTLEDGYTYDAISVEPTSGSVSGGTFATIIGSGTDFQEGDRVLFGRTSCTDVEVVSATRINCRTPPTAAGTVDVTVETGAAPITAPDAYTYFDSSDPFTGGLGGGPLLGSINVTVLDGMTGAPVPDAYAIVGEDLATEHQGLTDSLGQITFSGPDIAPPATVHIAKHCYERTSVVAFDARDVTVFLTPWMDPMCGMGSPPPGGGRGRNGASIEGELIWLRDFGLGPQEWFNVPQPRAGWVRVAYVYTTQASVTARNPDPWLGGAVQRVLEAPVGDRGYPYSIFARPAGLAVYALAGLEETATGRFIPYVMGITRSVLAGPGEVVAGTDIVMDIPLDHYVEVQLEDLPGTVDGNPDRFRLQANIDLAGEGVIVREHLQDRFDPAAAPTPLDVLRSRDASRPFRFTSQPALFGNLADGRYRIEAGYFTGDWDGEPYSVAAERGITAVDSSITIGDFIGIPRATAPADGERMPADRVFRWEADGSEPSLQVVVVVGADGNPAWRMFVPGNVREAPAPDFSSIPGLEDMPPGFVFWGVFSITIPGFDFDEFRYSDLNDLFWTRWAVDFYTAQR
jgi:hypothetical protein